MDIVTPALSVALINTPVLQLAAPLTDMIQFEESINQAFVWHRLWRTLKSYRLLIVITFLSAIASTYAVLQLTTEQYDISATVLVRLGRENLEAPMTISNGVGLYTITGVRPEEINSEIQLLTSNDLIVGAIDKIGIDAFKFEPRPPTTFIQKIKYYSKKAVRWVKNEFQVFLITLNLKKELGERDKVILDIKDRLIVERQKDSDMISVMIRLPDPELGIRLLNTLLEMYFDRHIDVHRELNFRDFMETQATNYLDKLSALDKQRENVRDKWDIVSTSEQKRLLLSRLNAINEDIEIFKGENELLRKEGVSKSRYWEVDKNLGLISEPGALKAIRERIAILQSELVNLLGRYDEHAEVVIDMEKQISRMENLLLRSIDARLKHQEKESAELLKQLADLNEGEDQLEFIDRERMIAKDNYILYNKRREEARISEELDLRRVSNISVISPPSYSMEPVYPKKLLLMALSVPLGLLIGLALAILIDYLRNIIRVQDDLADIPGLEYLGTFRVPKS
jgi:polysaccharide biosynthesis protein PslE